MKLLEGLLHQRESAVPAARESGQENSFDVSDLDLESQSGTSQFDPDALNSPQPVDWSMVEVRPECSLAESHRIQIVARDSSPKADHPRPLRSNCAQSKRVLEYLTATNGCWHHDKSNGQLRYYTSMTNIHVYSELLDKHARSDTWDQRRRAARIISDLSSDTYDYLMERYWTQHNSLMHVVDKGTFNRARDKDDLQYYSSLLHVCILAMGYRYADKSRLDIQRLTLSDGDSTFLREARYLFEHDVNHSADMSKVQALLLLGDLECSLGKDNSGWIYIGELSTPSNPR